MRFATALAFTFVTAALAGCGGGSSDGTGGGGGSDPGAKGESCDAPLVLFDSYKGTTNFTEPFSWGGGTFTPACGSVTERPAVFLQWTADDTEPDNFKVYVNGSESVTLVIFEGESCDGTPRVCTKDKLPIGADHVAGAYVPITNGQPITLAVVADESAAPSGKWTISMGD